MEKQVAFLQEGVKDLFGNPASWKPALVGPLLEEENRRDQKSPGWVQRASPTVSQPLGLSGQGGRELAFRNTQRACVQSTPTNRFPLI